MAESIATGTDSFVVPRWHRPAHGRDRPPDPRVREPLVPPLRGEGEGDPRRARPGRRAVLPAAPRDRRRAAARAGRRVRTADQPVPAPDGDPAGELRAVTLG